MEELRSQAVSGVKWNGVSVGFVTGLSFITTAILARLLSPSDFGMMGMIMVVIGFAQAFSDMGLSNAIIQRQDVPENHLSSFFWVNIIMGMLIFACVLLIRPLAVTYFKQPGLSRYLFVSSALFIIMPFGQLFSTLLTKELKFRTLAKLEIAGSLVYSIFSIALALSEFGVLSLILGQLIRSVFDVGARFFVFRNTWWPKLHFNIKEIRSYLSFGAFQMGERTLNYLSANVDYIIIGRILGPASLGYYTIAYNLMLTPLTKINPVLTRVAFPTFSRVQNDNFKIRQGYCKIIKYISLLSFPMLAGMFVVAPEFIRLVYGEKWEASIGVFQILCVVGAFKSLGNPVGSILLAKGRADIGFFWNLFAVAMVIGAVIVGVNWGIAGVAVAILVLQLPFFFIIQPIVNRLIELRFRDYFAAIQDPFICSVIMLGGIALLRKMLWNSDMMSLFITTIGLGIIIYILSYYIKDREIFSDLMSLLKGR